MDEKNLIRNTVYGFIGILVSCNLFFIKRLVDKIESMEVIVWQLRQEVVVLSVKINDKK